MLSIKVSIPRNLIYCLHMSLKCKLAKDTGAESPPFTDTSRKYSWAKLCSERIPVVAFLTGFWIGDDQC